MARTKLEIIVCIRTKLIFLHIIVKLETSDTYRNKNICLNHDKKINLLFTMHAACSIWIEENTSKFYMYEPGTIPGLATVNSVEET